MIQIENDMIIKYELENILTNNNYFYIDLTQSATIIDGLICLLELLYKKLDIPDIVKQKAYNSICHRNIQKF
jgi:hypothetical protein